MLQIAGDCLQWHFYPTSSLPVFRAIAKPNLISNVNTNTGVEILHPYGRPSTTQMPHRGGRSSIMSSRMNYSSGRKLILCTEYFHSWHFLCRGSRGFMWENPCPCPKARPTQPTAQRIQQLCCSLIQPFTRRNKEFHIWSAPQRIWWEKIHLFTVIPESLGTIVISFLLPSLLSLFILSLRIGLSLVILRQTLEERPERSLSQFSLFTPSWKIPVILIAACWVVSVPFLGQWPGNSSFL